MTREQQQKIFTHIPTLETERLILRKISPKDARDMFEYSSDADVTKFLLWDPHPDLSYTMEYVDYLQERYALGDFCDWALILKSNQKMIGTCGFTNIDLPNASAEIGYVLNPAYRGKGIIPEAAKAVIAFGFERLSLVRVSAICMKENAASLRVMQKCGMKTEGTLRQAVALRGENRDITICSVLKSEFSI